MNFLVTGAAGFIGSNLVDRLLEAGHSVIGVDNFSTGREEFLRPASSHGSFRLESLDLLHDSLLPFLHDIDTVIHFAANADVRFGPEHPTKDLEQNTIVTSNVLEAVRRSGVQRIAFASTGSVYGVCSVIPTPEDAPFPVQTSLYGASKLAAEGMICAYAEAFNITAYIFRFVSILGERYTHGHVYDFYRQILDHPEVVDILGDGSQRKSYLYVHDCVDAIFCALQEAGSRINIFNLGTDEYCNVGQSLSWICEHLQVNPRRVYSGGNQGWVGDNPFIFLDCSRIRSLGWQPKLTIREGIIRTLKFLIANPWVYSHRPRHERSALATTFAVSQ
jgi:UDP-glucose 4-epimerase